MSGSVNRATLPGHLGQDPEIGVTKDGGKIATVSNKPVSALKPATIDEALAWRHYSIWQKSRQWSGLEARRSGVPHNSGRYSSRWHDGRPRVYHLHLAAVAYLQLCPGLRWRHIPNGERRDKRTGGKLKAMGVETGVADLHLTLSGGQTGWIELKAPPGRQSAAQKAFQAAETRTGARYAIVRSLDDLEWTLRDWGVPVPHVIPSAGRDPLGQGEAQSFPPRAGPGRNRWRDSPAPRETRHDETLSQRLRRHAPRSRASQARWLAGARRSGRGRK